MDVGILEAVLDEVGEAGLVLPAGDDIVCLVAFDDLLDSFFWQPMASIVTTAPGMSSIFRSSTPWGISLSLS